jgi:hypothetical protein
LREPKALPESKARLLRLFRTYDKATSPVSNSYAPVSILLEAFVGVSNALDRGSEGEIHMSQRAWNLSSILASAVLKTWAAATNCWRSLMRDQDDNYRPEAHYMRGPGPKWREKNAQMSTRM